MDTFPDLRPEEVARRPGDIEVLLGLDVVGMHPVEEQTVGNQRVYRSRFGLGRLLVGQSQESLSRRSAREQRERHRDHGLFQHLLRFATSALICLRYSSYKS